MNGTGRADTRTSPPTVSATTSSDAAHYEQAELWGHDSVFEPSHQVQRMDAINAFVPDPTCSILDVGSGDGRGMDHLATAGGHTGPLFSLDRSRAALMHQSGSRLQASADALPLPDRSIDGIVCSEVLEHLPPQLFRGAVAEIERVARSWIVLSVPNREHRQRAEIRCGVCGCRYNADRHLRSFRPEDMDDLFERFRVDRVTETGPRQPIYPRPLRLALERSGLLVRPGAPSCPQCGERYRYSAGAETGPWGRNAAEQSGGLNRSGTRRFYDTVRSIAPKARHPYFLCVRFRRES